MEKRTDPKTGAKISLLGFGTMRLPKVADEAPEIDEVKAEELIDYAFAHDVNYYDTAYPYHAGLSELFIGKALQKYPRERFFLADKMPGWKMKDLDGAKRIFTEQMKKCRVDYFDFYLCHSLGNSLSEFIDEYEKTGVLKYLDSLRRTGVIRHLGFSFHGKPDVLEQLISRMDWDFVQIQLNYLDWDMQNAKRQYAILESHQLPCIIMEPVRGGTLCNLCPEAVSLLKEATVYPHNLGEGKLIIAQENNIYYFMGCAYEGMGEKEKAEECFKKASTGLSEPAGMMYYNDQPPETIFYQGLAWLKLGNAKEAGSRFNKLVTYGEKHYYDHVMIDYFAVSLPDLMIFDEDLDKKNRFHCTYMMALGNIGLGSFDEAESQLKKILAEDPNHAGAKDHLGFLKDLRG